MEFDDRLLRPDVDDPQGGGFWEHCAHEELRIQGCGACGRLRHPPRPMCPWCRSTDRTWQAVSGRATIWSVGRVHPPLLAAYAEQAPYNVVVVELEEDPGIRLVGNVVTGPEGRLGEVDADDLAIGDAVEVVFQRVASDVVLPRWRRV